MTLSAIAGEVQVVGGDILAHLAEDGDDIHAGAAAEGDELKIHRCRRGEGPFADLRIELEAKAAPGLGGEVEARIEMQAGFVRHSVAPG